MAVSRSVCLSFSPPPAGSKPPSLPPSKSTAKHVLWPKSEKSLKEKSFQGMLACAIIFTDMGIFATSENRSVAAIAMEDHHHVVAESSKKMAKWSEKRKCPSWQMNSLETIVPENLPRPQTRRRWEEVGDRHTNRTAPDVKVDVTTRIIRSSSCFSM